MSHFHKPLIVTYMVNIWADYSPNQLLKSVLKYYILWIRLKVFMAKEIKSYSIGLITLP